MIDNPIDAIEWLKQRRKRAKIGTNYYDQIIEVIRNLLAQRTDLNRKLEAAQKEIARLQPIPRPKDPWGTEGNGEWSPGPIDIQKKT